MNMATNLPPLPDVERLSPLVIRILGGNPGKVSGSRLVSYLLVFLNDGLNDGMCGRDLCLKSLGCF